MTYNIGDFIKLPENNLTKYPALIVNVLDNNKILVSIAEWQGDYKICTIYNNSDIDKTKLEKIVLKPYQKLYILSKYGSWFYLQHKSVYQSIIIENLCHLNISS